MKLRYRVLMLLTVTLFCLISGVYLLSTRLLLKSYARLERQGMTHNLERVDSAVQQLVAGFHEKSFDWANADDTYQFMRDHNRVYLKTNLTDATLQGMHLDAILYVDAAGKLFHAKTLRRLQEVAAPM